jgi:hypothetical protein
LSLNKPKISLSCKGGAYHTNFPPRRNASRRLRDHRHKNHPGDLGDETEKTPMIATAGDLRYGYRDIGKHKCQMSVKVDHIWKSMEMKNG